ncbi:alpha/beta hydrolase [Mycolicibacterium sp. 120266]|uniref:alpha/beta fold hydrolase n=1 Tax=Mycolicibacterium sp. 120266 TaxID=3090601 RepID=UPI00299D6361|nr:alpha/beta hydrolase [Mycolicibacterium sp. 120266]MDX1875478.1 alpha/beta hydrolase [Mycolicibacterium sp. 120266]
MPRSRRAGSTTPRKDDADPPSWFTKALAHRPEHAATQVDGCEIHLRVWGPTGQPPVVLVHGGAAHSGWWDHIAPLLCANHRVVALDLSGHGDSGQRPTYGRSEWAKEVMAAATAVGAVGSPTIIGHSMGGWVAATAAYEYGDQIDSVIVMDTPLREKAPESAELRSHHERPRTYHSKDDILSRFRVVPEQEHILPYIREHVAAHSIRRRGLHWEWKFDPKIFDEALSDAATPDEEVLEGMLAGIICRVGYVHSENGLVDAAMASQLRFLLQLRGPFVTLPEAGHHPMFDQPLALVAVIRTLLEFWSIT